MQRRRTRLLLVEDDASVRTFLQKFLEIHDFEVATAETSDEALDLIEQFKPEAAIVDLLLAQGNGREVVVSMPRDVPVIFSGLPRSPLSSIASALNPPTVLFARPAVETIEQMLRSRRTREEARVQ
jgi:ActR/RegA family two-component response regulator